MAYGVKKSKQQMGESNNILNAIGMGGQAKKPKANTPMAALINKIRVPDPVDEMPGQDSKLQQALDENRNVAEQLAAKRNVRRASSRQLLSSSRLETLGQGE